MTKLRDFGKMFFSVYWELVVGSNKNNVSIIETKDTGLVYACKVDQFCDKSPTHTEHWELSCIAHVISESPALC